MKTQKTLLGYNFNQILSRLVQSDNKTTFALPTGEGQKLRHFTVRKESGSLVVNPMGKNKRTVVIVNV